MTSAGAFVAAASGLNSSLCSALLPGLPIGVDSEGTSPKFPRANLHLHHWFPGNSMEDSTKSVHLRERVLTDDREGVFFFFLINLFIYFWLRWVFVAAHGLSLVAASGGYSSLWCAGFSLRWLLLLRSMGSRHAGFSSYGTQAQ